MMSSALRSTRTSSSRSSKAASCDIQPGRRPTGPALVRFVEEYRRRAGITPDTGTERYTPREEGA